MVENDEFNIRVAGSFLYACGYPDIVIARTAKEALERFVKEIGLILINVHLPDESGLEVCKKVRQMTRGRKIPILALAPKGKGIKTKCLKVGMTNVMSGRTSFNGFKEAIQKVIN